MGFTTRRIPCKSAGYSQVPRLLQVELRVVFVSIYQRSDISTKHSEYVLFYLLHVVSFFQDNLDFLRLHVGTIRM